MADILKDLYEGLTGQSSIPQSTILDTNKVLGDAYGALSSQVAPGLLGFVNAMAPGITATGLNVRDQLDPNILSNLRGANASILEQLNLGESLSPGLQADITRKLLETNSATGFGASPGGIGNVALQTALEGEARGRQRRGDALSAGTSGFQLASQLFDPQTFAQVGAQIAPGIAQDIRGVQAARDEYANLAEDIRRQNFSALINTGGRIIGGVVGGIYGGAAGAQMGSQIGGSLYTGSRVGGRPQQQQSGGGGGGGGFTSILSGIMGGGGGSMGKYSAGGGQYYGGEMGGAPLQQSTMASGVNIAGF